MRYLWGFNANTTECQPYWKLRQELRNEVSSFAEYYYDKSNASEEWQHRIEKKNINGRAEELLKHLNTDCSQKLEQLQRAIKAEIKYNKFNFDQNLLIEKLTNWRKIWGWTGAITGGALIIASLVFPLTIVAAVIGSVVTGVLSWFGIKLSDSFESKVQRAREKLSKQLNEHIDKIEQTLRKKMNEALDLNFSQTLLVFAR